MATTKATKPRRRKAPAAAAAAAKSASAPAPASAKRPAPKTAAAPGVVVRKRELIEQVVAQTGLKRRDVKAVTEAVLGAMGQTLADGQSLAVEPLGKLRVARVADGPAHQTFTVKLRQKRKGLAEAAAE